MKPTAVLFVLAITLALPAQAQAPSVGAPPQAYVPRLGDIMGATQLRHLKLWYAGKEKNWGLAEYELGQIKESFQDAMTLYPGLPAADMTSMAEPASRIGNAMRAKDSAAFARAFGELTAACNACHQAQGYGSIRIRTPTGSPFTNQTFAPK
jgi:hypothetical protein